MTSRSDWPSRSTEGATAHFHIWPPAIGITAEAQPGPGSCRGAARAEVLSPQLPQDPCGCWKMAARARGVHSRWGRGTPSLRLCQGREGHQAWSPAPLIAKPPCPWLAQGSLSGSYWWVAVTMLSPFSVLSSPTPPLHNDLQTTRGRAGGYREANTPPGIQILEDSRAPGLHAPLSWA